MSIKHSDNVLVSVHALRQSDGVKRAHKVRRRKPTQFLGLGRVHSSLRSSLLPTLVEPLQRAEQLHSRINARSGVPVFGAVNRPLGKASGSGQLRDVFDCAKPVAQLCSSDHEVSMTYLSDLSSDSKTHPSDTLENNRKVTKSSRELLSDNLQRIVEDAGMKVNGWAVSRRLQERKAARAAGNESDTRLDTLDEIARAAHVRPWELIAPPAELLVAQPSDGGDLDYLLTRIPNRKDRILAYALAAQVIDAIASGLVVLPIDIRAPHPERPRAKSRDAGQAHMHKQSRSATDPDGQ